MNFEPEFLTIDDVLDIHSRQIAGFGGSEGIRDRGLLESAIATPQASFGGKFAHSDFYEMAAAYAFHIAENQPFIDGNKRTGLLCALVFLDINGITIDVPHKRLYNAMIDIAEKKMDKQGLAKLFKKIAHSTE